MTPRHCPAALEVSGTPRGAAGRAARRCGCPPTLGGVAAAPGLLSARGSRSLPHFPVQRASGRGSLLAQPSPPGAAPLGAGAQRRGVAPTVLPPPWSSNNALRPPVLPLCKGRASMLNEVSSAGAWPFGDGQTVPKGHPRLAVIAGGSPSGTGPAPGLALLRAFRISAPSLDGAAPPGCPRHPEPSCAPRPGSSARPPDGKGGNGRDTAMGGDASEPLPPGPCSLVGTGRAGPAESGAGGSLRGRGFPDIHPPAPAAGGDESVSAGGKVKKLRSLKAGRDH